MTRVDLDAAFIKDRSLHGESWSDADFDLSLMLTIVGGADDPTSVSVAAVLLIQKSLTAFALCYLAFCQTRITAH